MPRDLAGLAGLGALGYMLANRNKGDKGADRDTDTGVDVMPSYAQQATPSMVADNGEVRDETGALSRFRRNTETGDLYSPDEPITRPSMTRKPSSSSDMRTMEYRVRDKADADAIKKAVSGPDYSAYPDESMRGIKPGATIPKTSTPKKETYRDFSGKVQIKKQKETPVEAEKSTARYVRGMRLPDRANVKEDQEYLGSGMKRGGAVKKMASGGMTSSASKRADGIASKGKTRGKIC